MAFGRAGRLRLLSSVDQELQADEEGPAAKRCVVEADDLEDTVGTNAHTIGLAFAAIQVDDGANRSGHVAATRASRTASSRPAGLVPIRP